MNSRRRKEISRRKVQVNVFSNKRLLFFMIYAKFIYVRKVPDLSLLLNVSKSHGIEGAKNGV